MDSNRTVTSIVTHTCCSTADRIRVYSDLRNRSGLLVYGVAAMIKSNSVINSIASMLHRPDPRLKASQTLSRILTQLHLLDLPYDEGVNTNRRCDTTRHVSIGVWLIPVGPDQNLASIDMSLAEPAVTCDIRRHGIGLLVPGRQSENCFLVAVADLEESWRFFLTNLCHQTPRPASWFHLGLDVIKTVDLEAHQMSKFRAVLQA